MPIFRGFTDDTGNPLPTEHPYLKPGMTLPVAVNSALQPLDPFSGYTPEMILEICKAQLPEPVKE